MEIKHEGIARNGFPGAEPRRTPALQAERLLGAWTPSSTDHLGQVWEAELQAQDSDTRNRRARGAPRNRRLVGDSRGRPSPAFGKPATVRKADGPGPGLPTLTYGSATRNQPLWPGTPRPARREAGAHLENEVSFLQPAAPGSQARIRDVLDEDLTA